MVATTFCDARLMTLRSPDDSFVTKSFGPVGMTGGGGALAAAAGADAVADADCDAGAEHALPTHAMHNNRYERR
jgi:hypothetical protein